MQAPVPDSFKRPQNHPSLNPSANLPNRRASGVDDVDATLQQLLSMGAKEYQPITERGEGFVTAAVVDPFGNVLGIMYNQHYLDVLTAAKGA